MPGYWNSTAQFRLFLGSYPRLLNVCANTLGLAASWTASISRTSGTVSFQQSLKFLALRRSGCLLLPQIQADTRCSVWVLDGTKARQAAPGAGRAEWNNPQLPSCQLLSRLSACGIICADSAQLTHCFHCKNPNRRLCGWAMGWGLHSAWFFGWTYLHQTQHICTLLRCHQLIREVVWRWEYMHVSYLGGGKVMDLSLGSRTKQVLRGKTPLGLLFWFCSPNPPFWFLFPLHTSFFTFISLCSP